MRFEYDAAKSEANVVKHGISFEEAKRLWVDGDVVVLRSAYDGEERFLVIGRIDDKYWTSICTMRSGVVRIISVRRSRKNEEKYYESQRIR